MRTTIEFPDALLRQLKSRAALEGTTLKALVQTLVERGLAAPVGTSSPPRRSAVPSISVGQALPAQPLSNARLFEMLDDA